MKEKELSNNITIPDPFLEPFYIQKDTYGYTVLEDATPDQRYTESVKKIQKTIGYYGSFGHCLRRIASLKTNNKLEYNSMSEYIEEWRIVENKINQLIKIDL